MPAASTRSSKDRRRAPGARETARAEARGSFCAGVRSHRSAFTLVELLVVIAIIAVLLGLIALTGTGVYQSLRRTQTQQTFRNIGVAIEMFSATSPLRHIYDRPTRIGGAARSFAGLPPYQPKTQTAGSVGGLFEPITYQFARPTTLAQRLTRDLSGGTGAVGPNGDLNWVRLSTSPAEAVNDDIRSLYSYLRVYEPGGITQIPEQAIKPFPRRSDNTDEAVRSPGSAAIAFDPAGHNRDWVEVRQFVDAWGVPLDYLVYVKFEPGVISDMGGAGLPIRIGWRVTDRKYVLRSHGVSQERYQERLRRPNTAVWDDAIAIYSSTLPTPYATVQGGVLAAQVNDLNGGWVRLPSLGDPPNYYGYLPGVPNP